jgi:hypothetical protein
MSIKHNICNNYAYALVSMHVPWYTFSVYDPLFLIYKYHIGLKPYYNLRFFDNVYGTETHHFFRVPHTDVKKI